MIVTVTATVVSALERSVRHALVRALIASIRIPLRATLRPALRTLSYPARPWTNAGMATISSARPILVGTAFRTRSATALCVPIRSTFCAAIGTSFRTTFSPIIPTLARLFASGKPSNDADIILAQFDPDAAFEATFWTQDADYQGLDGVRYQPKPGT